MESKKERVENDGIEFSKICDTIQFIAEKPSITFGKFHKTEIDELKFYIIRNNKVIKDTLLKNKITSADHYLWTNIPFENLKKTDTIIIETKNKRYFRISGFHHYAYLHYGMFGYLGSHDCRFAYKDYTVNGKQSNGCLLKADGFKENILPK
jgi:hypothetical protein